MDSVLTKNLKVLESVSVELPAAKYTVATESDVPHLVDPNNSARAAENLHDADVLAEMVAILWRRKLLLAVCVATAIAIALSSNYLIAQRYTATAVIRLDLRGPDVPERTAPNAVMDAAAVVAGQTRIIESQTIARRVAERLQIDEIPTVPMASELLSRFAAYWGLHAASRPSHLDIATAQLMRDLEVKNDPRSYLITVTYKASSPNEAARIANAIVSEYMHDRELQTLVERHAIAQRALTELSSTYGPKHPLITRAEADVALAQSRVEAEENDASLMDERELAATGQVVPAQAITIPSGARTLTLIGYGILGGIAGWIALIMAIEGRTIRKKVLRLAD